MRGTRVSTEFRRHGIPSVFLTSVYSVFRAELVKIPAEFRRIPCRIIPWNSAEFHGIPWLFSCTEFPYVSKKTHLKDSSCGLPPHNRPCTSQRIRGDESADRPYSRRPYSWPFMYPLYIVLVWNKLQSVYCSVSELEFLKSLGGLGTEEE